MRANLGKTTNFECSTHYTDLRYSGHHDFSTGVVYPHLGFYKSGAFYCLKGDLRMALSLLESYTPPADSDSYLSWSARKQSQAAFARTHPEVAKLMRENASEDSSVGTSAHAMLKLTSACSTFANASDGSQMSKRTRSSQRRAPRRTERMRKSHHVQDTFFDMSQYH